MNDSERRLRFREALEARRGLLLPGAFNALSARIVQDAGCEAVYLTGAGLTKMRLGLPDLAFVGLTMWPTK
jgi:2-methylisocitrate lyase-like PEP mutase family enzyme